MDNPSETIDLSGKKLKKLNKPSLQETQAAVLILDDNELQRLDNIDSFSKVQKLSAVRNQLLRMYGVCRLHLLHTLNLAHNGILTIEGLKELMHLKRLCLAGNQIKTIEHLNSNINLEHLDLSENIITHITDLSFLKSMQELLLHSNKIGHLRQCDRFLPAGLVTLTLANNNISDLNEISQLVHLTNLNSITFANNPCVNMTGDKVGFDYRPFIINWCMSVRVIDGYVVDAIESLRAEWLYSQGRGRHFRVGDQEELGQYLATVCPLSGETLETEEDRKLRLILSKAQHHQQQLRNQQSNAETPNPSPASRKKFLGARSSPRLSSTRLSHKSKSPDKMTSSCYNNTSSLIDSSPMMSQSLDPTMLNQSIGASTDAGDTNKIANDYELSATSSPLQALSKMVPVPESLMSPDYRPSPLVGRIITPSTIPTLVGKPASAKILQATRSPKTPRSTSAGRVKNVVQAERKSNSPVGGRQHRPLSTNYSRPNSSPKQSILRKSPQSSEEESEICDSKLQNIQMKVQEMRLQKDNGVAADLTSNNSSSTEDNKTEQAAVFIQKMWRGYYTRNKNKKVQEIFRTLQAQRADEYIQKLATDMESTKAALESERKIQMLQMQAINALWKKVSALQPGSCRENVPPTSVNMTNLTTGENVEIVKGLAETCSVLQSQIQQLQSSMQDIVKFMAVFSQSSPLNQVSCEDKGTATQTEISAVHTPQGEAGKLFPFSKQIRPSSLPLPNQYVSNKKKEDSGINQELKHYAGTLVDCVIKTVSESQVELGENCTADASSASLDSSRSHTESYSGEKEESLVDKTQNSVDDDK